MGIRQDLARWLDRPGGRRVLASVATMYARRQLRRVDVEVLFDGVWAHRIGDIVFPDEDRFDLDWWGIRRWESRDLAPIRDSGDYWFWKYVPVPGDVVVDVGAGRGEDVYVFSRAVGERGRVIAVEADPGTFRALEHFCRLNRIANVEPVHRAVTSERCTVGLARGDDWTATAVEARTEGPDLVEGEPLDAILAARGVTRVDLLKMNIEGAEVDALRGRDALRLVRHVCVSCHDFRADRGEGEQYRTREAVAQLLEGAGFEVWIRSDDTRVHVRDQVHGARRSC